jgi:GTP-binding protein
VGASPSGADRAFATFLLSAVDPSQFPKPDLPEIAFLGRSNVGKSSLLNALVGAKVAFPSGTPGRTRTVSFFDIALGSGKAAPVLRLADLPGYGWAKISRSAAREWPKFVDPYLSERESLCLCVVLVDASVPPQDSDHYMVNRLREAGRRVVVAATKVDKVPRSKVVTVMNGLKVFLGQSPVPVSSRTDDGVLDLWRQVLGSAGIAMKGGLKR